MGVKVTAAQAGWLVERAERVIRWHITRGDLPAEKRGRGWAIDVDDLARVSGWRVNRARLAEMEAKDARTAESMASQLATLTREVELLKARIRALEIGATSAPDIPQHPAAPPPSYAPISTPAPSYALTYRAIGDAGEGTFRTRTDAARWLLRHGVASENTPKSWPGWRDVTLDREAVLALAISLHNPGDWRQSWRLKRCDDPTCVCQGMLDG